eukprot:7388148-Prymnesium_polylepis.1
MHCPCTRHVVRCVTFYASFGSDLAPPPVGGGGRKAAREKAAGARLAASLGGPPSDVLAPRALARVGKDRVGAR